MVKTLITRGLMIITLVTVAYVVGWATHAYHLGFWSWPRLLMCALSGIVCVIVWEDALKKEGK